MNKNITRINFNKKWLSNGIGDTYTKWYNKSDARIESRKPLSTPSIVLINSPTGTGKTTFIIDKLIPYASDNHRNILYFGNRIALGEQLKMASKDKFFEVRCKSESIGNEFIYNDFNNRITILNYQSFSKYTEEYLRGLNPYYVIFDEAHYFIDDSLFNINTYRNFKDLLKIYSDSALIFMTATPIDFEPIFDMLVSKGINKHLYPEIYNAVSSVNITKYENIYSKNNYKLFAYSKKEEVIFKINHSPKSEKWLIFVNSKRDGKEYLDKIKLLTKRKVRLLTADNKNGLIWDNLIRNRSFKSDVLIVTRVIDSGVNITDENVKNVVLPFCVESDFIQMLGRRRNPKNELLNIYCENISIQQIQSKLNQITMNLNLLDTIIQINHTKNEEWRERKSKRLKNYLLTTKRKSSLNYIQQDSAGNLKYNLFAHYKLSTLLNFYNDLKKKYKNNPDFYLSYIKQWLKTNKPIYHPYSDDAKDLKSFLERYENQYIADDEREMFYEAFQYYYKRHCAKKFKRNKARLDEALNIRKGTTQRKATINKSLKMLNLPYKMKKENKCWVLKKQSELSLSKRCRWGFS